MPGKTSTVAILATVIALLLAPGAASAQVFCVHNPSCPVGGVTKSTLTDAVQAAETDAAKDTVRIGPGAISSTSVSPQNPIDIVGSGMGATEIDNTQPNVGLIYLLNSQSKLEDLTVGLTQDHQQGVRLAKGADVERMKIKGPHSLTAVNGFIVEDSGSALKSVVVDLGPDQIGAGIVDLGQATITDSVVTAGLGIQPSPSGTTARRVTVHSFVPLRVFGGGLTIANALLTSYPGSSAGVFEGAEVENGNAGQSAVLSAANLTIVGPGSGYGISVRSNSTVSTGFSKAIVQGAIIRGAGTDLWREGDSATESADIEINHSAYNSAKVDDGAGNGAITKGPGNLTSGADPRFVNPAAGDYRLRFDSPLLDKGASTPYLVGDDPDLGGRARVRDSDGNGSAVRDIGAYEYQRRAPVVTLSATPATALTGSPFAFKSTASDPDGDPVIARAWSFGDGATASGTTASHAYSSVGARSVRFSARDASGVTGSATKTVTVLARPVTDTSERFQACANRRAGGTGADLLSGSPLGDLLLGGAGPDRLFGRAGRDCLHGDAGNDRLSGGADRDVLAGGSGRDRLSGGSGKDRLNGGRGKDLLLGGSGGDRIKAGGRDHVKAGSGNDRINAANGKPNRVACGKGRDRVEADRIDLLSGCERVSFRRR